MVVLLEIWRRQILLFIIYDIVVGTFKSEQYIDVLGYVADGVNPFILQEEIIHSVVLQYHGTCNPVHRVKEPIYNPGVL